MPEYREYLVSTPDGHDYARDPDLEACQQAAERLGPGARVEALDQHLCRTGDVVYTVADPAGGPA